MVNPGAPESAARPHLVWDWNGTLFDDVAVVVAATDESFRAAGLRPVTRADYHAHYTRPIPVFYERLLGRPVSEPEWIALNASFHSAYRRLVAAEGIGLVEGSRALLAGWVGAGGRQSLLSMYRHEELVPLVERLGIGSLFARVDGLRGGSGGVKAEHLRVHLGELGVSPADAVVIGDSIDDADAAAAVGARAVLYAGGFHGPAGLAAAGVPVAHSLADAVAVASLPELERAGGSTAGPERVTMQAYVTNRHRDPGV